MKAGHCDKCIKKINSVCITIDDCKIMSAEMNRIEYGRAKGSIQLVYQHNMGKTELRSFNQRIYGAEEGIRE